MNKNGSSHSAKVISPCYRPRQVKFIFDNQKVSKPNYLVPKPLTPKSNQKFCIPKIPSLQRYSSEIQFINHRSISHIKEPQPIGSGNSPRRFHKKTCSQIQEMDQQNKKSFRGKQAFIGFNRKDLNQSSSINLGRVNLLADSPNKKVFRSWNVQKITQLKETSQTSTLYNSNLSLPKYPSFVKNKSSKKLSCKISGELSLNSFNIIRKLGSGKFGKVLLVRQNKTGFLMAMKVYEKKKIVQSNYLSQFISELKIQAFLDHPSIIKIYGFFHDQVNFYTLMELGCDGQLYKLIKNNKALSQRTTSYIIRHLLAAVDFLHQRSILHRDIKPQNIVLIHGTVKLCDFGWVSLKKKDELRNTYCGTPLYLSPQMLKGSSYDQKVDIWAIGVLAYQLRIGCSPFNIKDPKQLYKIITQPLRFPLKDCSAIFKEFISCILQKNPELRSSPKYLLKLEFIQKYKNEQVFQQLYNNRVIRRC